MSDRSVEDVFALSPLQQGMLFHALFAPEAGIHLGQFHCELLGEVDVPAFRRAWQRVLDHHPVLRTSFHWEDLERPLQVVHAGIELPWRELDWRHLAPAAQRARLQEYLAADQRQGFSRP